MDAHIGPLQFSQIHKCLLHAIQELIIAYFRYMYMFIFKHMQPYKNVNYYNFLKIEIYIHISSYMAFHGH